MKVIGYLRVSTQEQADSRLGLQAQRQAIQREADHRGWDVAWIEDAGHTGRNDRRPGLQEALRLLRTRKDNTLVVAKLDRLSRSVVDFGKMLEQAKRQRWAIVSLDPTIDLTTATGRMCVGIIMEVAQWESEMIGERVKAAMERGKANGATYGRQRQTPTVVVKRIVRMRTKGMSYRAIAAALDKADVPTPDGATNWQHSTVRRIVTSGAKQP